MSNIIESLIADIRHHEQSLIDRLAENKREEARLRKLLQEVRRHRKRLERDHPGGEAVLPLGEPEEDDEDPDSEPEPTTLQEFDEEPQTDDRHPRITDGMDSAEYETVDDAIAKRWKAHAEASPVRESSTTSDVDELEPDEAPVVGERGLDHEEVGKVSGAEEGAVEEHHVAGPEPVTGKGRHRVLGGERHRAHVPGAVRTLGDHASLRVEEAH